MFAGRFLPPGDRAIPHPVRGFEDERRLIALATVRNRRQIGRVGLDQHALQWNFHCGVANLLRLGKSHIAGERNHESHVERALGLRPVSREAMQNAAQSGGAQRSSISPRQSSHASSLPSDGRQ